MKSKCIWYAVMVELNDLFINEFTNYGISNDGKIYQVNHTDASGSYAVIAKYGKALKKQAIKNATSVSGIVITVTGDYMFNNSDIRKEIKK